MELPWDEPDSSDIVVQNDGDKTPEAIVERLVEFFQLKELAK